MKLLKEAAQKITSLEIQGATNIAMFAVRELVAFTKRLASLSLSRNEMWEKLYEAETILSQSRSTEPAMRNGLLFIIGKLRKDDNSGVYVSVSDIPKMVQIYGEEYENILKEAKRRIAKYGARLIPEKTEGSAGGCDNCPFTVQTHCHSSVVEGILIEAAKEGKNFQVVNTETRPFYQGRTTAKNLAAHGIPVIHVVDSAMRWAARNLHVDLIIIGADAVTSEGTVLNKIGSRLLALVAREEHIPLYVATPLLKYNPDTAFGNYEKIEMRDTKEIWRDWPDRPDGIEFKNPAFETVNRLYINGLITEAGIFPTGEIHNVFRNTYRFLFDEYHALENKRFGGL
jgi:ribose 1,5-bisphosphate isomerase